MSESFFSRMLDRVTCGDCIDVMHAMPWASVDGYWDAVDAALLKFFAIDTSDAGIEPDLIASAQEEGQTPEEFALWFGDQYGLQTVAEWKALWGHP